ncbi:MAG: gamma-glutamyltransferase family protein [Burkholderiaceae bacterium]|nr:gamma-glutamyltransferase family protein [Burkholderiaceae bacterium]
MGGPLRARVWLCATGRAQLRLCAALRTRVVAGAAALLLAACALAPRDAWWADSAPVDASARIDGTGRTAQRFAVAAANPLATEAGYRALGAGGSAVDAAIAVQMVLTLVEPQSSGIGGGAFLLHWDGQRIDAFDGRETAPAAADEKLFLQADGKPMPFAEAVVGGRAVGVPGAVRMLELAHRRHGKLPWAQLFEPAIRLAEQGFPVSPRLHAQLQAEQALRRQAHAAAYFYGADGQAWPVGHRLKNPALAAVLRATAEQGSAALHTGPIARDIVRRVQAFPGNPGRLTEDDLAHYEPVLRSALCDDWLARYRVCGFPPPSSGHLAVMQILKLLQFAPPSAPPLVDGLPSEDVVHRYSEAARLAFADRAMYVGDPAFVAPPAGTWRSLLADDYLRQRAALIGARSMQQAQPGAPTAASAQGSQLEQPEHGTSHVSIVDAQGRVVAMTTTIEAVWGSRILADGGTGLPGGFLLNNELTDFSFAPVDAAGRPIANRVQPGKRPRSSMSPTLVFNRGSGAVVLSAGSPGGAAIIHYTAKTLIGTLDWGLDPQAAIALPNFGSFNGPTLLERGRFAPALVDALRARGHTVQEIDLTSGLQALHRTAQGWRGGADRRREGVVLGD